MQSIYNRKAKSKTVLWVVPRNWDDCLQVDPIGLCVVKHTPDKHGMEAYRLLMKEYQPVNRARSLELFHQILNYRFQKEKGIAENILEYEERSEQYEKSAGEKVQEHLKVSTLIQGMKPAGEKALAVEPWWED